MEGTRQDASAVLADEMKIFGIVQGVGFRPHVFRLAAELGIRGWILNSSAGVFLEVEAEEEDLREFTRRLLAEPPPLALIRDYQLREIEAQGFSDFQIRESESQEELLVMVSPDIAVCHDCRREVMDPVDRRYAYPFINCTNCGPRFTIIKDLPYDRAKTTMAEFTMCPECDREYHNPLHRRFHAQPNACPLCGPHISMLDSDGNEVEQGAVELLKKGCILAVKGLGGCHLAVDARNREAVSCLRQRKHRDAKPFALMARDLETARKYCHISYLEEQHLTSGRAPIVVMESRTELDLPRDLIHPGLHTLGIMLSYTPLHYLLFDDELELLVMTSANISDEPLIYENETAQKKLAGIADYFLLHNRDIFNPCDDSVMRVTALNTPQLFRRARGYVPLGIRIPSSSSPVLAVGGEMKNTFCITRQGEAYLSQHWGDLNHYLNFRNFLDGIERFKNMLAVEPQVIAHDLHPNYQTTRWAGEQEHMEKIAIQHHWAHMASAMAENQLQGEVLGLICDGTGWGTDGAVWGGEILQGDYRQFSRLGHLQYLPLPGGDLTARRPYRMALIYLLAALGEKATALSRDLIPAFPEEERELMLQRWQKGTRELQTSSCGRLFDAVAAVLGICTVNRYEGQAAVELEVWADYTQRGSYSYTLNDENGMLIMNLLPMWLELLADQKKGISVGSIAQKFHLTLVNLFTSALDRSREKSGLNRVVLSGGVFHNQILLFKLSEALKKAGFEVYHQQQVPPGDGGIALGQAILASEVKANVSGSTGKNTGSQGK